jgi:hypothetical protein
VTDTETPPVSRTGGALSAGTPAEAVSTASLKMQHELVKSLIPTGAFRTDDHRYYFNGEGPLPSVTTVLEILDKPALSTWKAQQAVRAVLSDPDRFVVPVDDPTFQSGMADRVREALAEVRKTRTDAASVGSGVHHLADMALRASESDPTGWKADESTQPYLDAFRAFTERYSRSSFVSSEKMVWSLNGYAGTYDLLMMIEQELWLLDLKTGARIDYPEYALQLAAYRWADSIIIEGNPLKYEMPNVDRTGILHLRPDKYPDTGYRLYEVPTTYESDYMTFLGLLEAYKWKQKERKPVPIST